MYEYILMKPCPAPMNSVAASRNSTRNPTSRRVGGALVAERRSRQVTMAGKRESCSERMANHWRNGGVRRRQVECGGAMLNCEKFGTVSAHVSHQRHPRWETRGCGGRLYVYPFTLHLQCCSAHLAQPWRSFRWILIASCPFHITRL